MAPAKKTAPRAQAGHYTARIIQGDWSIALRFDWQVGRQTLMAERLRSARVFQVAAALEIKAAELGRRWPVSPSSADGVIKVECDDHERAEVIDLLAAAATANNITVVVA